MTSEVNWGLVIASGVVVGLLILILITSLYLLLTPPPASEPLGTPDGVLACSGPTSSCRSQLGLAAENTVMPAEVKLGIQAQKG